MQLGPSLVPRYDEANAEKQRLEEKQRAARKALEQGVKIKPRWFEARPDAELGRDLVYSFTGDYWEARDKGDFSGVRDIFGPDQC